MLDDQAGSSETEELKKSLRDVPEIRVQHFTNSPSFHLVYDQDTGYAEAVILMNQQRG